MNTVAQTFDGMSRKIEFAFDMASSPYLLVFDRHGDNFRASIMTPRGEAIAWTEIKPEEWATISRELFPLTSEQVKSENTLNERPSFDT